MADLFYLVFSILTNAAIYVIFKWYGTKDIRIFDAIVFNYLTAACLGLLLVPDMRQAGAEAVQFPVWLVGGAAMGFVFIAIFYLMAITSQRIGVSIATVSSKMSLALAALLFVWVNHEPLSWQKLLAIILAIAGVVFTSIKKDESKFAWKNFLLPFLILLGSTIIDFGVAHFSLFPKTESELALFTCTSFAVAGFTGWCVFAFRPNAYEQGLRWRDALAGVGLGTVNYGSIYFLVKAYDSELFTRSTLLPINNLAVVLLNVVAAIFLFREKQSAANYIGILFCAIALSLLIFQ